PALAGATVLPPGADLTRPVRALTLADPEAPAEQDAVLLCPGPPPDPIPAGCAALVCRAAPEGVPLAPVLVLPPRAPWGPVVSGLAAALAPVAGRAAEARSALRAPLLEGRGHGAIAQAGRELLGVPVALMDEYLDLLGAAGLSEAQEAELE